LYIHFSLGLDSFRKENEVRFFPVSLAIITKQNYFGRSKLRELVGALDVRADWGEFSY